MARTASNPTRDYGITQAMSVPKLAAHIGLAPRHLYERINAGDGPRVIRLPGPKRATIRILQCDAIAWLRSLEG